MSVKPNKIKMFLCQLLELLGKTYPKLANVSGGWLLHKAAG